MSNVVSFNLLWFLKKTSEIILITVSVLLLLGQTVLYPVKISCKTTGVGSFKNEDFKTVCAVINYPKPKLCQKITVFINLIWKCPDTLIPNTGFLRGHCWYNTLEITTACNGYKWNISVFLPIIILQDCYSYEQTILMLVVFINTEDNTNRFIMVMNYLETQTWTRGQGKLWRPHHLPLRKVIFNPIAACYKATTCSWDK